MGYPFMPVFRNDTAGVAGPILPVP
jgi:hypothetical protein